jgi:hypothetical protein
VNLITNNHKIGEKKSVATIDRRGALTKVSAGIVAALAGLGLSAGKALAASNDADTPMWAPIVGPWHLRVHFKSGGPFSGKTDETLATFQAGGTMVESNGTNPYAHFGAWTRKCDGLYTDALYTYHLVEFNYDASGNLIQVAVPNIDFMLDSMDRLHSVAATTTLYIYSPESGALANTIVFPNVSEVTGQRISATWIPPTVL